MAKTLYFKDGSHQILLSPTTGTFDPVYLTDLEKTIFEFGKILDDKLGRDSVNMFYNILNEFRRIN